jgi:hypothetical protein
LRLLFFHGFAFPSSRHASILRRCDEKTDHGATI